MKRKAMIIGFALACLLIIAVVGMMTPWKAAAKIATPQPVLQSDVGVPVALRMWKNYSTPFLIGTVPNDTYEVTAGTYRTVVKIHNYSEKLVGFVVKAVIATHMGPPCTYGAISPWVIGALPPDASKEIDETNIRLFLDDVTAPNFLNGFVQVASTIPIDVSAIHTADTTAGKTMDIEPVPQVTLPMPSPSSGTPTIIETSEATNVDFYVLTITPKLGAIPLRFAPVNVSFTAAPLMTGCGPATAEFPTLTTDCYGVVRVGLFRCGANHHYITIKSGTQIKTLTKTW
jgi:hypothetical protein